MSKDVRAELQQRLGSPDIVARLSDAEAEKLLDLVQAARRRQREALTDAQQQALRYVPPLLRRPLLKLLEG